MVDIGNPHVERHHAQFEGQPCNDEHQSKNQHLRMRAARHDGLEHSRQFQAASCAIDHGHAVQQEARGHRAQHKVLHGRFARAHIIAAHGHQRVARQGQQFQAQVQHQEMVARDHHAHAQQGKQAQAEQLATAQHLAVFGVGTCIHQGDHGGHGRKSLEPVAHGVADKQATKTEQGLANTGCTHVQEGHKGQGQQGQHIGQCALGAAHGQINQRDHAGHDQQHDFRIDRHPAGGVHHGVLSVLEFVTAAACSWPRA